MGKYRNPIQYFVNEQKGVVVAKMDNVHDDCIEICDAVLSKALRSGTFKLLPSFVALVKYNQKEYLEKANIADTLVTKARCNYDSGDVFDEEHGKSLARARLLEQLFFIRYNVLINVTNELFSIGDAFAEAAEYNLSRSEDMADFIEATVEQE